MRKFDFLIIGAQKAGTTWLWNMLDQHPGTDLPNKKEIHYFGGAELYRQGPGWYYSHFDNLRSDLLTGEASTSYLFDRIPYWENTSRSIEYPDDLSSIPELVAAENPDAKIVVVLRDPVHRALSAYKHWMRQGNLSPLLGLRRTAEELPKMRILEYGFYARYLAEWEKVFPKDQMCVLVFEEDVKSNPDAGLRAIYEFLGLDATFRAADRDRAIHRSWSWTRCALEYYAGPFRRVVRHGSIGEFLDRSRFLDRFAVRRSDIEFLRENYLREKPDLEALLGRELNVWSYGEELLAELT